MWFFFSSKWMLIEEGLLETLRKSIISAVWWSSLGHLLIMIIMLVFCYTASKAWGTSDGFPLMICSDGASAADVSVTPDLFISVWVHHRHWPRDRHWFRYIHIYRYISTRIYNYIKHTNIWLYITLPCILNETPSRIRHCILQNFLCIWNYII